MYLLLSSSFLSRNFSSSCSPLSFSLRHSSLLFFRSLPTTPRTTTPFVSCDLHSERLLSPLQLSHSSSFSSSSLSPFSSSSSFLVQNFFLHRSGDVKGRRTPRKEDTTRQISSSISFRDLNEKEEKERCLSVRREVSNGNIEDDVVGTAMKHTRRRRTYDRGNDRVVKESREEDEEEKDLFARCGGDHHEVDKVQEHRERRKNRKRSIDAQARCPKCNFFFYLSPPQLSPSPYRSSQSFFSLPNVENRNYGCKDREEEEEEKKKKKDRRKESRDVLESSRNEEEKKKKGRAGEKEEERRRILLSIGVSSTRRRGEKSDRNYETPSSQRISSSSSLPFSSLSSFILFLALSSLLCLLLLRRRRLLLGTIDSEHRLSSEGEREGRGEREEKEEKEGEKDEKREKKEVFFRERKEIRNEGMNDLNNAPERSPYSIQCQGVVDGEEEKDPCLPEDLRRIFFTLADYEEKQQAPSSSSSKEVKE
ncbi:hypothetical protein CSUI_008791 [Cystoisospora suis]|uniref:Transmembrane protein n=1 Tax=Cystoisospora suis TaxID=483139 RepID=A0A2C6K7E3_9APIC|nr:hypothetical protein CSUI_008791 [Cystoisospora suis]